MGFKISPADYIRVEQLVARVGDTPRDPEVFRHQLASMLCKNPTEQRIFQDEWDRFVESHGYVYREEELLSPRASWWKHYLPGMFATLGILAVLGSIAWFLFRPMTPSESIEITTTRVDPAPETTQQRQRFQFKAGFPPNAGQYWRYAPPIDSIIWYFGDGSSKVITEKRESTIYHVYEKPGTFQPRVHIRSGEESLDSTFSIKVLEDIPEPNRLVVRLVEEEGSGSNCNFAEYAEISGNPDSVTRSWKVTYKPDSSKNRTFGDTSKVSVRHDPGEVLTVQVIVAAYFSGNPIPLRDSAIIEHGEHGFKFEKLDYQDENISGLLMDLPKTVTRIFWGLLFTLCLYLLGEVIAARFRNVSIDEAEERGPPLRQRMDLEIPPLSFLESENFYSLALQLRLRRAGEDRRFPDLPGSLKKTIRSGGLPDILWKYYSRPSQYLLLVEEESYEDHLAKLYTLIGSDLSSRDITVEVYVYRRDPMNCRRPNQREYLPLGMLAGQYAGYRLLIIGTGADFFSPDSEESTLHWADSLALFPDRAILSTRPTEQWGHREQKLAHYMVVVPATQQGFMDLVGQWAAEEALPPGWWVRHEHTIAPPEEEMLEVDDPQDFINEMRAYLGDRQLTWLAACAWYPELYWELSLQLGQLLHVKTEEKEEEEALPFTLDELMRFFRLPWFREGKMPGGLREALAAWLPKEDAAIVRSFLMELITRNPAPEGSYAEQEQQVRKALFQFLNSPKSIADKEELKNEIKKWDPDDIEDQLTVSELSNIKQGPLSMILPARWFKGNIPLLGMKRKFRMLLVGVPWILLSLVVFRAGYNTEFYDEFKEYPFNELRELTSLEDSAKVLVHNAYARASKNDSSLLTVKADLRKALKLDATLKSAGSNLLTGFYNEGIKQHKSRNFSAVRDTLERVISDEPLLSNIRTRTFANYMLMGTYLQMDSTRKAKEMINTLCEHKNSFVGEFRDSVSKKAKDLQKLLERKFGEGATLCKLDATDQGPCKSNFQISGTVKDALNNEPLSGVKLNIGDLQAQTDARGSFTLKPDTCGGQKLPPLTASLEGYRDTTLVVSDSLNVLTLMLFPQDKGVLFQGIVLSVGGAPISGVTILNTGTTYTSDPDGKFGWFALQEGKKIDLQLRAEGYLPLDTTIEIQSDLTLRVTLKKIRNLGLTPETILVPGGTFMMGSNEKAGEKPIHQVTVPTFEIGKYEVTQKQWQAVMGNNPSTYKCEECPVEKVSWNQVQRYIENLNKQTNSNYRLPSEAEWEYAAGGGSGDRSKWSGTLPKSELETYAWYKDNSGGNAHPVGQKRPNSLGIYDMIGNILEWCQDGFYDNHTGAPSDGSARPGTSRIVVRGGSWGYTAADCRISLRQVDASWSNNNDRGFRLARSVTTQTTTVPIPKMKSITGGTFMMGSNEGGDIEKPVHQVTVSAFEMGEFEVTQKEWKAVMGNNPSKFKCENCPVETVSWNDVQVYIGKLNQLTKSNFRLPTEAEWEYAAGGGANGYNGKGNRIFTYSGSNDLGAVGWYGDNSDSKIHTVGQKAANALGIYDMSGNAWEWCQDWFGGDYPKDAQTNPKGSTSGTRRVLRGGSWGGTASSCRVANRHGFSPINRGNDVGFRLARTTTQTPTIPIPKMKMITGGTFMMGSEEEGATPVHKVTLSSFELGIYEVTQKEWEALMGSNPSKNKCPECPVEEVSWDDVLEYIQRLNKLTNSNYRLPTEAEWEYAAGGGANNRTKYAGTSSIENLGIYAWHGKNSGNKPHPVGQKQPNALGIYDMSGNVFEWCSDYWMRYSSQPQVNPQGLGSGTQRVIRGGSSSYNLEDCMVTRRNSHLKSHGFFNMGFRLARTP